MEHDFEVGEVVFFMGKISPWFWHKGAINQVDEEKGFKIGKVWYSKVEILKDVPNMAGGILTMNIEKSMMMCKGMVQYEGEKLNSYLERVRTDKGEEE